MIENTFLNNLCKRRKNYYFTQLQNLNYRNFDQVRKYYYLELCFSFINSSHTLLNNFSKYLYHFTSYKYIMYY